MQISERLNFNNKLMDFCIKAIGWNDKGNQSDYQQNFVACL